MLASLLPFSSPTACQVKPPTDSRKVQAYFVPALGPAPKWSSFLENLTEELEESAAPTLYEDYR